MKLVWNGDKVIAEFNNLKKSIEHESATVIESKAKAGCPVDSGALKASIRTAESKHKDGGYSVLAGEDVFYASFIELGTNATPGIPFLRRAADNEGIKFRANIETMVKKL